MRKKFIGLLAIIGLFLVIGGVGKADYADEIGTYMAMKDFVPQMIIGFVMMLPGYLAIKY